MPHPNTPVFHVNTQPIANAGPDQIVFNAITLDGSQSSDQEDDLLIYSWAVTNKKNATAPEIYSGSLVTINNLQAGFYNEILTVTYTDSLSDTSPMIFIATGTVAGDINADGKIGLEESINALKVTAGETGIN